MKYDKNYFETVKGTVSPIEQNWKFEKILPALKIFFKQTKLKNIKLLEIGAGSGFFIKNLKEKFKDLKDLNIEIFALEINEDSVKYLRKIIPEKNIIINDISKKTKFKNKDFNLCVAIDVLEHIEDLQGAINEIKRIADYLIIKIPIEKTLGLGLINIVTLGKYRRKVISEIGHIHWFTTNKILSILKNNFASIEYIEYTNLGLYQFRKYYYRSKPTKTLLAIWYLMSAILFRVSKYLNAIIFGDHIIVLVKC